MKRPYLLPVVLATFLWLVVQAIHCQNTQAEPFVAGQFLNETQVMNVTAVALAFITPRTLEPVKPGQLVVWGLRGLTTLDPKLTPDLSSEPKPMLRLIGPSRVLLTRPAPADNDIQGWAEATGQMIRAGWDASEAVRRAGTGGVIRTFFDEVFNHLDPYSRYAPPDEASAERLRRAGRASLGITVAHQRGSFFVQSVDPGGNAAQGGVHVGDRILSVDGQALQGADLTTVRALLTGSEGSEATLVLRGADGRQRRVSLIRALLPPETVTATMNGDIVLVVITSFSRNTAARFAQELIRYSAMVPRPIGVVIDLRGNRGGVLQQAVAAAAMLQPDGLVASTAGRNPEAAHDFLADGRDLTSGLPVVIMVDGRTASAAEIMAAALVDQRRAVVLGSVTLGKGLVQSIANLPDGGELFVTWSRVLAPLGWPIQGLGLLPQLCTSKGQETAQRQFELLARGLQPMAASMARHNAVRPPLSPAIALEIRNACPAAEGREDDLAFARRLIATPVAYMAALQTARASGSVLGSIARPVSGLTPTPLIRN